MTAVNEVIIRWEDRNIKNEFSTISRIPWKKIQEAGIKPVYSTCSRIQHYSGAIGWLIKNGEWYKVVCRVTGKSEDFYFFELYRYDDILEFLEKLEEEQDNE